jgi:hypothetical protein
LTRIYYYKIMTSHLPLFFSLFWCRRFCVSRRSEITFYPKLHPPTENQSHICAE